MTSLKKFLHVALATEAFIVAAAYSKPLPYTDTISNQSVRKALTDAFHLANTKEDLSVVIVRGNGMRPYFADGAILVIKHSKIEKVDVGSIVVYKDKRLNVKVKRIGQKNSYGDLMPDCGSSDVITEDNYLGEVYVTFYTDGPAFSTADIEFAKANLKTIVASSL